MKGIKGRGWAVIYAERAGQESRKTTNFHHMKTAGFEEWQLIARPERDI